MSSIAGYFDRHGDDDARASLQRISLTGDLLGNLYGEHAYVVDEDARVGAGTGGTAYWVAGNRATMLLAQIDMLRQAVRKRGTLWRVRFPDGARQWKTARFLRMSQPQVTNDRLFKASVTCEFESAMTNWHAETATTFSKRVTDGTTRNMLVSNPGATAYDAVLTVTAVTGPIVNFTVNCEELGIALGFLPTAVTGHATGLLAGESFVMDAGRLIATLDGDDAYVAFGDLSGPHTAPGWLPIRRGNWAFELYSEDGTADFELSFYPQFA